LRRTYQRNCRLSWEPYSGVENLLPEGGNPAEDLEELVSALRDGLLMGVPYLFDKDENLLQMYSPDRFQVTVSEKPYVSIVDAV
jgi:hypothetical protein